MTGAEAFGHWLIGWLQAAGSPELDGVARIFSFLGDEEFYLLLLPLLLWTVHRRVGLHLAVLLLASAWINAALKALAGLPRPDPTLVDVMIVESAGGLPSGHAQNALVVWGYLAWALLRRRFGAGGGTPRMAPTFVWGGALVLTLLIGWSRLHLGVHFPHDLLAGWLAGALLLAGALSLEQRGLLEPERFRTPSAHLLLLLPLAMLLVYREHTALPAASALLGAGVGMALLGGCAMPEIPRRFGTGVVRLLVGLVGVGILWFGVPALPLPGEEAPRILRYLLLGGWLTGGAPFLFRRLGI